MPIANSPPRKRAEPKPLAQGADTEQRNDPDYEENLTPLEFMYRVMRNRREDPKDRKDAAKLALPYSHSRLSPIAPPDNQESDRQRRYKEAKDSVLRKISEFKSRLAGRVPEGDDG